MKIIKTDDEEKWVDEDGFYHRKDGPAVIYGNGSYSWWIHGLRHRLDGPAVCIKVGEHITFEWWVDGDFLFVSSQEEFEKTSEFKRFKLIAFT